ncbi:DivIVA domain-containing protein [Pediococcus ethanolidurans]|uniref:DivIVA domain-containing protein n=1 Tax=Pediococcus ethanolidurans TaxID=319653 RepID=UPI001C1F1211|nr:DivIVA domain-containing protein [Pediococcus ethanolidurans]MBU7554911.1 DivIVA domain-containing protein [Pediococcus ethanolidurans]MBU7563460.1 DivIVA domain-containing protein [Pediococcus ethanolidurans]MCT4397091.1 DivIVA domain-containing protein [Pediococcus ethanolidurans]MCV3320714.1 DivIVA domain-containing protein [Pediococcus ethanolidurans]MCV3322979.1 DivIVA domain-containing protein [Pediococcus ethanolidurans]
MSLDPVDIQNKQFSNKMRGYNPNEVDEFLQQVAIEYRQALDKISALQKEVENAETKLEYFDDMKESLNKSILVAQDAADKVKSSSKREAELTAEEAQKQADGMVQKARVSAEAVIDEQAEKAKKLILATNELRKNARLYRQRVQVLVDSQLQMINGSEWDSILKEDQNVQVSDLKEAMLRTGTLDKIKESRVNSVDEEDPGDITPAVETTSEENNQVQQSGTSAKEVKEATKTQTEAQDVAETEAESDKAVSETVVVFPDDKLSSETHENSGLHVNAKNK